VRPRGPHRRWSARPSARTTAPQIPCKPRQDFGPWYCRGTAELPANQPVSCVVLGWIAPRRSRVRVSLAPSRSRLASRISSRPAWPRDAVGVTEREQYVGYVLVHLCGHDGVERTVGERQRACITGSAASAGRWRRCAIASPRGELHHARCRRAHPGVKGHSGTLCHLLLLMSSSVRGSVLHITATAKAMSSGLACSRGEWLIPSTQGMKTIADGARRATTAAS
jgi:hypothetical protein